MYSLVTFWLVVLDLYTPFQQVLSIEMACGIFSVDAEFINQIRFV